MGARPSPYLMLLSAMFFWGATYVIVRAIHEDVPPITLNFWRWVVVLVLLLPWTAGAAWRHREVLRRNAWLLVMLSATGVALYQCAAYIALNTTTAINAGLIYATVPVVTPLISYALDRELVTVRQGLGIAVSMAGVVTIIGRAEWEVLTAFLFTPGDLWMVLSVVGVVVLLPFYGWEWARVGGFTPSRASILGIAYLSIASAIVGYVCWNKAVAVIGANKAGLFVHLIPVFTVVLAVVFLDERLRGFHVAGTAFIAAGIYLTVTRPGTTRSRMPGWRKAG